MNERRPPEEQNLKNYDTAGGAGERENQTTGKKRGQDTQQRFREGLESTPWWTRGERGTRGEHRYTSPAGAKAQGQKKNQQLETPSTLTQHIKNIEPTTKARTLTARRSPPPERATARTPGSSSSTRHPPPRRCRDARTIAAAAAAAPAVAAPAAKRRDAPGPSRTWSIGGGPPRRHHSKRSALPAGGGSPARPKSRADGGRRVGGQGGTTGGCRGVGGV